MIQLHLQGASIAVQTVRGENGGTIKLLHLLDPETSIAVVIPFDRKGEAELRAALDGRPPIYVAGPEPILPPPAA